MLQHRVCIIGAGGIAQAHMKAYKLFTERSTVVACCDLNIEKAKQFAEKYGIPKYFDNAEEMLNAEQPDIVNVCTWNRSHADCSILALKHGANVLCEKPMALNASEAQEMVKAAESSGKLLQVGFVRRFGADANVVKQFIDADAIGDIYYAKAVYLRKDGCPGRWFGDKSYAGGGPLIDLGVHIIDLVRYLCGNPIPVSAYGVTYANLGANRATNAKGEWRIDDLGSYNMDVEDLAVAIVKFDNGLTLNIETSYNLNCHDNFRGVQLFGTKAGVNIDSAVEVYNIQAGVYTTTRPDGDSAFRFDDAFANEISSFMDACEGKTECRATAGDGLYLMKILDAIYLSAETGKVVDIK